MPLQIKYLNEREDIPIVSYKPDTGCFSLKSGETTDLEIEVSYRLDCKTDYSTSDYLVFMFACKEPGENEIFQVYEKENDNRIGWIFPIQALQSKEHSFADNEHFLKYAFVAFHLLCKGETNAFRKIPNYEDNRSYSIDEFYAEDSIILCLSKKKIDNFEKFSIDDYLPSLFKWGYYLQVKRNPDQICISAEKQEEVRRKLKVGPISSSLKGNRFVKSLLSEVLPYEDVPLLAFFYLYQIVELLIEKVLIHEQRRKIDELIDNKDKPFELIEIVEKMKGSFSEKSRLISLFNNYLDSPPYLEDLKQACNEFLEKYKRKSGTDFWNYLYNVRNLLFHQYRNVEQADTNELREIVKYFRIVIPDLLMSCKIPVESP